MQCSSNCELLFFPGFVQNPLSVDIALSSAYFHRSTMISSYVFVVPDDIPDFPTVGGSEPGCGSLRCCQTPGIMSDN